MPYIFIVTSARDQLQTTIPLFMTLTLRTTVIRGTTTSPYQKVYRSASVAHVSLRGGVRVVSKLSLAIDSIRYATNTLTVLPQYRYRYGNVPYNDSLYTRTFRLTVFYIVTRSCYNSNVIKNTTLEMVLVTLH